jgi:hypothetical protein
MGHSLSNELSKLNAVSAITIEPARSDKGKRRDSGPIDDTPSTKRIILQRTGMWTGTLANGLEITNTRLYQDKNPANAPDYYVGIGQSCVFNVTKGELIDLRADSKNSVVVWPQGRRRNRS